MPCWLAQALNSNSEAAAKVACHFFIRNDGDKGMVFIETLLTK
jgi:hypothetical protein